ncbi:MAG: helicase-related protein, partial [Planctomycetota bacterium]
QPEKLRELLREVMIRNTRATSGVRLPPRTVRTVVVEQTPGEQALYTALLDLARQAPGRHKSVHRLLLEEAGSSAAAVARTARSAKAESSERRSALDRLAALAERTGASRKIDWLLDMIPGGKLLVFTRFRATHEALMAELEGRGIPCVAFAGGMSAEARAEATLEFRGPVDVMVCTEVGGEGQNLQFCHRLLNFDLPWNPMLIEQRIGRLHRIGQEEPVEVVNLCTAGTAEERILEVLDARLNLFELVVGEMDLVLGEVEDERDFGEQVYDVYAASRGEDDVRAGFAALGDRLAKARDRTERTKEAAEAAFGDALGT